VGFCAHRAALNRKPNEVQQPALSGFEDFHDAALTWIERNFLLRHALWPRSVYLELLPLDPSKGKQYEPRIPSGEKAPTLHVRAWRYVVTDRNAEDGLRLLTWEDVQKDASRPKGSRLFEGIEAEDPLGDGWAPRDSYVGLTVDEVELKLEAFPVRTRL